MPQVLVAQKVTTGVYKGVTTSELDELAAETAASMTANHPDYAVVGGLPAAVAWPQRCIAALCPQLWAGRVTLGLAAQLAARVAVSNLHKNTLKSFSETCAPVLACPHTGAPAEC